MDHSIFDSPEYRRSRTAYVIQCAVEYMVLLLISDAFLAKLLLHVGLDDATIGIISSLLNFAFLIEIIILPLMSKFRTFKWVVVIADSISIFFSLAVYLLPFIGLTYIWKKVLAYVFVAGAPIARYVGHCLYTRWANAYVDPYQRASFSAVKEMVSLAGGIAISLVAGYLMDKYEAAGDIEGAFVIISWYIFLSAIINLVSLLLIKNLKNDVTDASKSFSSVMVHLLRENKPFRCLLVCESIEYFAIYITLGFLGTYKTSELGFSVWSIQIITSISFFVRLLVSLPVGRYTDSHSYARGFLLGMYAMLVSFAILIFTSPDTRWLMIAHIILYNTSLCAIQQNRTNMLYNYAPLELFPQALAIKESVTGIIGFLASLVGSRILIAVQAGGNSFLGINMYAQQVLSIISCVLLVCTILYTERVLLKQPKMRN